MLQRVLIINCEAYFHCFCFINCRQKFPSNTEPGKFKRGKTQNPVKITHNKAVSFPLT